MSNESETQAGSGYGRQEQGARHLRGSITYPGLIRLIHPMRPNFLGQRTSSVACCDLKYNIQQEISISGVSQRVGSATIEFGFGALECLYQHKPAQGVSYRE